MFASDRSKICLLCAQDEISVNNEVLACVSNGALISRDGKSGMLRMWIDGVQRAKVKNYLVIAIDDEVRAACPYGWCSLHH